MNKVGELMIPVEQYVAVGLDKTLLDVFVALDEDWKRKNDKSHAHRDVLVVDDQGEIKGKITMVDIVMALEPNYRKIKTGAKDHDVLTSAFVARIFQDYDLWTEPLDSLCPTCSGMTTAEVMHTPLEGEYVDFDEKLETAVHRFVVSVHQPLLVRRQGKVVGVLRFGDVFEEIRRRMQACGA